VKVNPSSGEVTLKATDGSQVLKFKASEISDIKRIEKLTRWMVEKMTSLEMGASDVLAE
jgi:hypothetical protein